MSRTTLKDLAKALNTTIATVSRSLHDSPEIGDNMKNRVREIAHQLNYKANTTALSLKYQKTFRFGVIFPKLSHYYVTQILSGMLKEAGLHGYKLLISESNYNAEKELEYIQEFYELNVDAILILPGRTLENKTKELEKIIRTDIPFLILDRPIYFQHLKIPLLSSNDYTGTCEGIEHLIEQGYTKIAHLKGLESSSLARNRHKAYVDTLKTHEILYTPNWVITCKYFTIEDGIKLAHRLMKLKNPPDAIYCINDIIAIGVLQGLKELGIKVPQEVGVLGFSNSDLSQVCTPALSSINQPGSKLGKKSIQLVLSSINNNADISKKNIVLKTKIVVRESTQRKL